MVNFSIKRKGYDKRQVDEYLKKVIGVTDNKLKELRQRVELLRKENKKLRMIVDDYRLQEKNISDTLLAATKEANDIAMASEVRYKLEGERLRVFKEKWTSYVENAIEKVYKIDEDVNMVVYLDKMDKELYRLLNNDLNIKKTRPLNMAEKQYISEQDRLDDNSLKNETIADIEREDKYLFKKTLEDNIKKSIEEMDSLDHLIDEEEGYEEDGGEDASNALSEICKELGINLIDE